MYKCSIIVASDKGYKNERIDGCVDAISQVLDEEFTLQSSIILPDDIDMLANEMIRLTDEEKVDLILISGGTGFSIRDVTPEATRKVIEKETPGLSEAMRYYSMQITKKAMLSRAISGIRKQTLIINLPGSPKAAKECLGFIIEPLKHGLDIMIGSASECGSNS